MGRTPSSGPFCCNAMKSITYILTILIFLLSRYETKACTCIGESNVKSEIKSTDAVFVGTITKSEEIRIYDTLSLNKTIYRVEMKYTMVVETVYKGRQMSDTAFIFTGIGGGDCGFNFNIGQKYIVYAGHLKTTDLNDKEVFVEKNRAFNTNICTRTRQFNEQEIKEIEMCLKKKRIKKIK
jgi:hypothetical protein